jgi:hypothetical protein
MTMIVATRVLHAPVPIVDANALLHRALAAVAGLSGIGRIVLFLLLVTLPHD